MSQRARSRSPSPPSHMVEPSEIYPEDYKSSGLSQHHGGTHTFIECDVMSPGKIYVLEEPIIVEMDSCVYTDGDEYGDRIYLRRVTREDREKLNAIINSLISEVETFAEPARVKRPLRWQFFAHRAKDMKTDEIEDCACYWSKHAIPKMCWWAKITLRIHGVGYFHPTPEQYWPVMDAIRVVKQKEPRKGCCLAL